MLGITTTSCLSGSGYDLNLLLVTLNVVLIARLNLLSTVTEPADTRMDVCSEGFKI